MSRYQWDKSVFLIPTFVVLFQSVVCTFNTTDSFTEETYLAHPNITRGSRLEEITLISFLQNSVKKYGEKKVASSIHELSQRSLYDLMWLLAGDLEPWLIYDLYKVYNQANADPAVLSVYEKFKAGNVDRTIVPEVFALDKRYNEYDWWRRVRSRMLDSTDKYMAGTLKISSNPPPNLVFTPDGKPVISAAAKPQIPVAAAVASPQVVGTTEDPDDEDGEDSEDSDLLDFLGL